MSEFLIMKSQANEVFNLIQNHGIPPEEFEWREGPSIIDPDNRVSILIHKSSGFYFQFDFKQDRHFCKFSPGNTEIIELDFPGTWSNQTDYFGSWLGNLKREIEAPDLWGAIANEKVLSEISYKQNENTQFSIEEINKIQESLNEIKQYLISFQSFSPEQLEYLEARFNYLKDAAERMGRKDWIVIVIGTLTNIIITLALSPSIARELLRIAGIFLKWFLGTPLLR